MRVGLRNQWRCVDVVNVVSGVDIGKEKLSLFIIHTVVIKDIYDPNLPWHRR